MNRAGRPHGVEPISIYDLIYADDVILAMAHMNFGRSARQAWSEAISSDTKLCALGLSNARDIAKDMIISPQTAIGGFSRRTREAQRAPTMELKERDAMLAGLFWTVILSLLFFHTP